LVLSRPKLRSTCSVPPVIVVVPVPTTSRLLVRVPAEMLTVPLFVMSWLFAEVVSEPPETVNDAPVSIWSGPVMLIDWPVVMFG
jgi:hypothetical protein